MGRLAAGNLTERLTLRQPADPLPDGGGGWKMGASSLPQEVWAQVRVISGTEVLRLGQALGTSLVEFTLRFAPEVTVRTRVDWQGNTLGIRQVVHDPRKEFTTITCVDNGR